MTPLFDDEFQEFPLKRALAQVVSKRDAGAKVIGAYCSYAPVEVIWAMGGVPAVLCAFSNAPIAKAEETLPVNLCPLIKSSFGFIELKTCPFFELTDAVVQGAVEKMIKQRRESIEMFEGGGRTELAEQGYGDMVSNKTGLVIDAYFSGSKLRWLLENVPGARADVPSPVWVG